MRLTCADKLFTYLLTSMINSLLLVNVPFSALTVLVDSLKKGSRLVLNY